MKPPFTLVLDLQLEEVAALGQEDETIYWALLRSPDTRCMTP
jgi:hypothetical protein